MSQCPLNTFPKSYRLSTPWLPTSPAPSTALVVGAVALRWAVAAQRVVSAAPLGALAEEPALATLEWASRAADTPEELIRRAACWGLLEPRVAQPLVALSPTASVPSSIKQVAPVA